MVYQFRSLPAHPPGSRLRFLIHNPLYHRLSQVTWRHRFDTPPKGPTHRRSSWANMPIPAAQWFLKSGHSASGQWSKLGRARKGRINATPETVQRRRYYFGTPTFQAAKKLVTQSKKRQTMRKWGFRPVGTMIGQVAPTPTLPAACSGEYR